MTKTELKEIEVDKIKSNPMQPREHFDREKLKELAESILSNGLINPIQVKKREKIFEIVSGERRWQAHKIAGLKTIQAFVKTYKDKVQEMVESLVENLQRENLTSVERENCVYNLWKVGKFKGYRELARKLGANRQTIEGLIHSKEFRDASNLHEKITTRSIEDTKGLQEKDRKKLLKQVEIGRVGAEEVREYARTIKKEPKEIPTTRVNKH